MNTTLLVTLSGLTAAITWGVADFLSAKSSKKHGAVLTTTLVNSYGLVVFLIIYSIFYRNHLHLSWQGFTYAALSGSLFAFGIVSFFQGLNIGPVSLVSPLSSTYPLITTLIAVIAFHSHLNTREILGIILVVIGVAVTSGFLSPAKHKHKVTSGIKYALLAALIWGFGFALLAQAIKLIGWQTTTLIDFLVSTLLLTVMLLVLRKTKQISDKDIKQASKSKVIAIAGLIYLFGFIILNVGISRSTSTGGAVITAISSCYPTLTVFLALNHLKEKVKAISLAGAFLGIIGIVVLSI